jgi:DNA-binding transcriptional MocR family regulator
VVREIALAINAGQLRTGERLPGTRALAEHLRISRNTILNPTTPSHDIRRGWVVAESIFERVSRLLSGKLQDSVDRLEQAGGAAVRLSEKWTLPSISFAPITRW